MATYICGTCKGWVNPAWSRGDGEYRHCSCVKKNKKMENKQQQLSPLEQYRDKLVEDFVNEEGGDLPTTTRGYESVLEYAHRKGFDAALALELPIRFSEWASGEGYTFVKGLNANWWYHDYRSNELSPVLYKYWLDNIFKINDL